MEKLFGTKASQYRKARIKDLLMAIKGNRNWKDAFMKFIKEHEDEFPKFYERAEGWNMLQHGTQGNCDDERLLEALEKWIVIVKNTKPDWYVKQGNIGTTAENLLLK